MDALRWHGNLDGFPADGAGRRSLLSWWKALVERAFTPREPARAPSYAQWIERCDRLTQRDRRLIEQHIAGLAERPRFRLLVVVNGAGRRDLNATLQSLHRQLYRDFTVLVLDAAGALTYSSGPEVALPQFGSGSRLVVRDRVAACRDELNGALAGPASADWVMLVPAGDVLPEHALYWFACEALARPEAGMLYADDDELDPRGARCRPRFKPDWSPEHLRSTPYIGHAFAVRGRELAEAGGITEECCALGGYDLLLRMAELRWLAVVHVPAVLHHRGAASVAAEGAGRGLNALRAHLARKRIEASVTATLPGCFRVRYALPVDAPMISIVVPTRDALPLIRRCVESVEGLSTYRNYELIVVDNGSRDLHALTYLADIAKRPRVRVLRYDHPFNYSAINNFAARHARGQVLCLLNNDTEVISRDWMEEMLSRLLQPGTGVVGAKLYFPDGRVQHAGDAVGAGGCANHLHPALAHDAPGYCRRAMLAHELSAVTGACLMTWRHFYEQLGGLDEVKLKVAFNDVDYCLRVQAAGYRVIWTPYAELFHHESASRGGSRGLRRRLQAFGEVRYMRGRWAAHMKRDPYYNPNLNYRRPDFALGDAPRVDKPWLKTR